MVRIVHDPGFGIYVIERDYVNSYYLMHHGVPGQKRGRRRWQNKDGSYTPEGYQHYKEMYGWGERDKSAQPNKATEKPSISEKEYRRILKSNKQEDAEYEVEKKQALSEAGSGDTSLKTRAYYKQLDSGRSLSRSTLERNAGHTERADFYKRQAEKELAESKWLENSHHDSFLNNRFGAEFDRGVKNGKNTDDPEIRELYIMERSEAFDTSRDKVKATEKKLETLRDQSLDNLDKSIASLQNGDRAESDRYFKMYTKCKSDIETAEKQITSEIEELGKAAGYGENTYYEHEFSRASGEYAKDKKACAELNTRLKNADAELVGNAKTLSSELESSINAANTAWDKFSGQWVRDHPGKDWDGDGTEFHGELLKQYPEYKKITEQREKNTSEYVKACMKLIKSDAFRDLKYADKFKNYFECIVDSKTGNEWYKAGESAAYALSQVLFPAWSKLDYVDPMYFVESFDKDWKDLGNPRLPA